MIFVPAEALGMLDLMEDPLFPGLDPEDRVRSIRRSIDIGRACAAQHLGCDPEADLVRAGVVIRRIEDDTVRLDHASRIQAQIFYGPDACRVELHMAELLHKQEVLTTYGLDVDLDWVARLHLAHEFYHFLEFSGGRRTGDEVGPIRVRGFLRSRPRVLRSASEIAAHTFAETVTGSPIHPKLTDYLVLVSDGTMTEEEFAHLAATAQARVQEGTSHEDL